MIIKIIQLLLSLSLLVIIHEFGHFLFARLFGCRVEKFYLFFDWKFSLFKRKIGQTEYGIGWIPLGGYVKISGMVDESMDKEQLASEPKAWEFRAKPAWQRLLILSGGVLMNLLLAMFIYIGIAMAWGDRYIDTKDVHGGFEFSQTAQNIGFANGDKIISVNGERVENSAKLAQAIILAPERRVLIERNGQQMEVVISDAHIKSLLDEGIFVTVRTPFVIYEPSQTFNAGDSLTAINGQQFYFADEFRSALAAHKGDSVDVSFVRAGQTLTSRVAVDQQGRLGVRLAMTNIYPITERTYNFFEAIPHGVSRGVEQISSYLDQLRLIFSPETEAYKGVGGFISMGKIFPETWSWFAFWNITALLSIMLAVLNIMPIPALDGGHLLFVIYEMIRGKAPSQKFMEAAQYVGFVLVLGIVLLANGNDILKLFR